MSPVSDTHPTPGRRDGAAQHHVGEAAERLGLTLGELVVHGPHRAKIPLALVPSGAPPRRGRYVLVTAMTPSGRGAGKTVTTIGLSMALNRLGRSATATLRQSSFGPTFGGKGGGAGGGAAQVLPLEECLLGLGADDFAVESANNLLAAVVDDALHRGADVDPATVSWRRVIDMDDRALRQITAGLGGRLNGPERETGFDITAASEVMAILGLSRDLADLRRRIESIVPAWDAAGRPVTAGSLQVAGAMTAILVDTLQPNLMHTSEGTPAIIHTGPFGNIAQGNCSVTADLFALSRSDFVVTEAGFGSDLGAEKFFHLKCPVSGESPDAVVIVATLPCIRGQAGPDADPADLGPGLANLSHHVESLRQYGVPVLMALNRFPEDSDADVATVLGAATDAGATAATTHSAYVDGGEGALELAQAVVDATVERGHYKPLVERDAPAEDKVETVATRIYGAAGVEWSPEATARLAQLRDAGFGSLPVCLAKTHLSLSHDPKVLGAPSGYALPVREVRLAAGAGYLTVLTGDISTMPGLPSSARFREIDVLPDGTITGLT